jgi:hypothetical protein
MLLRWLRGMPARRNSNLDSSIDRRHARDLKGSRRLLAPTGARPLVGYPIFFV